MVTPLVMLALMIGPFLVARLLNGTMGTRFGERKAAAIGLGLLFIFTSIGHFALTETMVQMLPPAVPARLPLVYVTGVIEILIAIAFFIDRIRLYAGAAALIVLVLFFPANVYAALNSVPMGGHAWGPVYLLIRVPVQIAIIAWIYWFILRPAPVNKPATAPAEPAD